MAGHYQQGVCVVGLFHKMKSPWMQSAQIVCKLHTRSRYERHEGSPLCSWSWLLPRPGRTSPPPLISKLALPRRGGFGPVAGVDLLRTAVFGIFVFGPSTLFSFKIQAFKFQNPISILCCPLFVREFRLEENSG